MSADENMPDFDSMSPEEVMAWMETLAKRQGGDSRGFTTSADMEIAEVDPDSVDQESLGEYIPHGWTKERWEQQLAKEAAEREEREKVAAAAAPPPAPEPVAEAPPPPAEPEPAVADAGAGEMDLDSMSPEELMEWMESLAKRQGADTRGFTTSASMDVAEVDPDSVDQESLGEYIPHGWTKERWEQQLAKEAAERESRDQAAAAAPPPPPPPVPEPEPEPEPEPAIPMDLPVLDEVEDSSTTELAPPVIPEPAVAEEDSMSWLEELAGSQSEDIPDFSAFDAETDPLASIASLEEDEEEGDPLSWLGTLAEGDSEELDLFGEAEESAPAAAASTPASVSSPIDSGDDPLEWMESLAKRQGAEDEELATAANLDIPEPEASAADGPGYVDYSFESPDAGMPDVDFTADDEETDFLSEYDDDSLDDPENWLDRLAASGGTGSAEEEAVVDDGDDDAVLEGLSKGTADPDAIRGFFERAFDKAETLAEEEELAEAHDPNAPAVPSELPDWLLEQMQGDTSETDEDEEEIVAEAEPVAEAPPPLIEEIVEPPEVEADEVPDWLRDDLGESEGGDDISDIFADEEEEPVAATAAPVMEAPIDEIDVESTSDSWVTAFQEEAELEPGEVPDWYQEALEQVTEETAPEPEPEPEPAEPVELAQTKLPPETDLPAGEPEAVPDWLSEAEDASDIPDWLASAEVEAPDEFVEEDAAEAEVSLEKAATDWLTSSVDDDGDMPDWLSDTSVEPEEVPDWLLDTLSDDEQEIIVADAEPVFEPEPEPEPLRSPVPETPTPAPAPAPVPAALSPAPVPAAARDIDVAATLQAAREKVSGGDLDAALIEYESVVRANDALDQVVEDLSKLVDGKDSEEKKNPAVYRVLGDAKMRQGNLQDALDTYRQALNLL